MSFTESSTDRLKSIESELIMDVYGGRGMPWYGTAMALVGFVAGAGTLMILIQDGGTAQMVWVMVLGFALFAAGLSVERKHSRNKRARKEILAKVQAELRLRSTDRSPTETAQ